MAFTYQISPTDAAILAVIAQSYCRHIRITENRGVSGWPTSDFLISKPLATNVAVRIEAGAQYTFTSMESSYGPGTVVGYIKMVTGSTTFDQDESNV